ncbi:MAG: hypothetical protein AB7L66_03530 [Gemmatimonadales bacterium]
MTRLDRIDYVDGSRLLGRDLGDTAGNEARWLGLHVSRAHDTWGVATGLTLSLTPSGRTVVVAPGAAFDCKGQALTVASAVILPEPGGSASSSVATEYDVVLGRDGPRWEAAGPGAGPSGFGNAVRIGQDIPLGRWIRLAWGHLAGPDQSFRKVVHPVTRPKVGFGLVQAGGLRWIAANGTIGATIDTSASQFGSTPRYVAWLAARPDMGNLIGPFLAASAFYPDHFTVRLLAVSSLGENALAVQLNLLSRAQGMGIAWVGTEPNAGGIA